MSNGTAGVFDPGATTKVGDETFAEADIALRYGLTLKKLFHDADIEIFMTRSSSADPAPVGRRATRAKNAGCTHFVSIHLNSDDSPQAHGVEVQFRDNTKDKPLADNIQAKLLSITGFNDHQNDQRLNLAVLKFTPGPAVLVELGFITNDNDRNFLLQGSNRDAICKGLFDVITSSG